MQTLRHAIVKLWKVRNMSNFEQVGNEYAYVQLYVWNIYKALQLKPRLKQNGTCRSMTVPLPLLSPSSILPPSLSHCAFHSMQVKIQRVADMVLF